MLPFCPESPKYLLLEKNDDASATSALAWLRGTNDNQAEMDEMKQEHESIKQLPKVTFKEMIVSPALRSPLIIAMMMMLAQQLSGINAVIYYSTSIFKDAGLTDDAAQSATLGMGAMNVAIVMVITFVVGFATGPGSIPWFFVTELFTQSARGMATAIAVLTNWSANFLVGLGFEPLKLVMGPWVFIIFIVLQILFIIYIWFKVPETKNKPIEEIVAQFRQNI